MQTLLADRGARLMRAQALLDSLNPDAVLARGYAIVRDEHGAVLHDAGQALPGTAIEARLARGSLIAEVREARKDN